MDTNYTIYCHRNKINNKAYIGQTGCVPYTRRWSGHEVSGDPYRGCRHFQNAIYKYGWDNFGCNGKTLSCGKHPKTGQPLHWKYLAEDLILYKNE